MVFYYKVKTKKKKPKSDARCSRKVTPSFDLGDDSIIDYDDYYYDDEEYYGDYDDDCNNKNQQDETNNNNNNNNNNTDVKSPPVIDLADLIDCNKSKQEKYAQQEQQKLQKKKEQARELTKKQQELFFEKQVVDKKKKVVKNDNWNTLAEHYSTTNINAWLENGCVGTIELEVAVENVAIAKQTMDRYCNNNINIQLSSTIGYQLLSPEQDAPIIHMKFYYDNVDNDWPTLVEVTSIEPPSTAPKTSPTFHDTWKYYSIKDWIEWLDQKAKNAIDNNKTHDKDNIIKVCQMIQNDALDFIGKSESITVNKNKKKSYYDKNANDNDNNTNADTTSTILLYYDLIAPAGYRPGVDFYSFQGIPSLTCYYRPEFVGTEIQKQGHLECLAVSEHLKTNYLDWVQVTCPICLDNEISLCDAYVLPNQCRHVFCKDCITNYCKTIIRTELPLTPTTNPFICPVPNCSEEMKLVGTVKPLITKDEMNTVRQWFKDVVYPQARLLNACPREQCTCYDDSSTVKPLRYIDRTSKIVYCDDCSVAWCERCLQYQGRVKLPGENRVTIGLDNIKPHDYCNADKVLSFCLDYAKKFSDKKKERLPKYLRDYAEHFKEDIEAIEWVRKHACLCPGCGCGVERTAGCFHMKCKICATHFCYECGHNFGMFFRYGSHRCWEEREREQQRLLEQQQANDNNFNDNNEENNNNGDDDNIIPFEVVQNQIERDMEFALNLHLQLNGNI